MIPIPENKRVDADGQVRGTGTPGSTSFYDLSNTPENVGGNNGWAIRSDGELIIFYDQSIIEVGATLTNPLGTPNTQFGIALLASKQGVLVSDAGISLGGINGGSDPYRKIFVFNDTDEQLPILNEFASDAAENRFSIGSDYLIPPREYMEFIKIGGRWRSESARKADKKDVVKDVKHFGDNNVPRPVGYSRVNWIGWVEPLNAEEYDTYDEIPEP